MTAAWQSLDQISARVAWGKIPKRTMRRALEHAVAHVAVEPDLVRVGPGGREYSPKAVETIVLCLRGRGLRVDGRAASAGEREAWEQLHG